MANRFPLIANGSSNQIQEIANGDGLDLTGNNIVGVVDITASGNVSVGGTLTYEDVTNVDSVGLITARAGVNVSAGGVDLKGVLQEKVKITAGKLSDNQTINLTNGMVHYFTTAETTTATPNIVSTTGINTEMATGDVVSVTIITTAAAAGYAASVTVDGAGELLKWVGGSAPTTGAASGLDIYTYSIIKTGNGAFTIIGNLTNAA
tara:strand:+ start:147 stop:764 length:618 start_codon:yes stop_codon:yes gene_type:complete